MAELHPLPPVIPQGSQTSPVMPTPPDITPIEGIRIHGRETPQSEQPQNPQQAGAELEQRELNKDFDQSKERKAKSDDEDEDEQKIKAGADKEKDKSSDKDKESERGKASRRW